jgi:hypothetical protein
MKIRFLLDEHLPKALIEAVRHYDRGIDILLIGVPGTPPRGTLDPGILVYCEATQRVLVTDNRKSMPVHINAHLASGRHHWGVFEIDRKLSIGDMAHQLQMFWGASEAEEWKDQIVYLPY